MIFIQLCSTESAPVYDYIWIKKSFINLCQRPQCFCELLQWGSRQRAALYHSQPPVGFCPWLRHTPHSHHVSLSTMDRSPSAGLGAGPSLWARLQHDTQRRIPPGRTTQRLTQIAPISTPPHPKKTQNTIREQSCARFHSFSSATIMNMNNPLAQTWPSCAILFCIQALKMSTQRQKGKLRNKSDNKMCSCMPLWKLKKNKSRPSIVPVRQFYMQ